MADVAQANADLKYGTLLDAIKRRIGGVGATRDANEVALQGYGTTGRGIIDQTYNVLDQSLASNRADTGAQINTAAQNIGQGYRDANSLLDTQRGIARDYAAQAGVADNQVDAYSRNQAKLEQVIADLMGRNAQQDATYTGNLKNWGTQMDSIFSKGQDIGRQSRADAGSRFETSLLDALANNRLNAQKEETDLYGQELSTLNERGNFLVSESDRLAQQAWERALQQAQLNQSAQQANAELALRQRAMDQDQANTSKEDYWKQLEFDAKQKAYQQGINESDRDFALRQAQFMAGQGAAQDEQRMNAFRMLSDPDFNVYGTPDQRSYLEATAGLNDTRLGQFGQAFGDTLGGAVGNLFGGGGSVDNRGAYDKYNDFIENLFLGDRQPGIEQRLRKKLMGNKVVGTSLLDLF